MPYAQPPLVARFIWATLLACCLQASLVVLADETPMSSKSADENPQMGPEMSKRDWNKPLKMWGKRGWNNLHGGWGLKRNAPSWSDQPYSPPVVEKRAWQNLQGGWGKRYAPEEEYAMQQIASMLDQDEVDPQLAEYANDRDIEANDDEKRNWRQFNEGWGKRNNWQNFRGSWGKRDPAWSNLKGIWGKRSYADRSAE